MRFFIDKQTRMLIHGINSPVGQAIMEDYSSKSINVVGGIEAGEGGGWCADGRIPIFDSVQSGQIATSSDAIIICVPPHKGYDAIIESFEAKIPSVVCLTGDIPLSDLSKIRSALGKYDIQFIGPGSYGIISPGNIVLGAKHWIGTRKGHTGLISYSESIAVETALMLGKNGFGISTAIGLGRKGYLGVGLIDILQRFNQDPETDSIVLIENALTGYDEATSAFIMDSISKPLVVYLPEIKNPAEEIFSFTGLKDSLSYQRYQLKIDDILKTGVPMAGNVIEIVDILRNL
jgi:succinyl-CoA synthetase alpha subunit